MRVVAMGYHAMRVLRFRGALVDFLRRWGIYLAIAVLVAGAGTNAPLVIAAALAGQLLRPLIAAADHGWWIVPMALAYAAAGVLPVVLTRPLWWPRGWAAAERALPIEAQVLRRSDRIFSWIVSAPWQAVLLVGVIGFHLNAGARGDAWHGWTVVGAVVVAALGSQRLALQWMRFVRRGAVSFGLAEREQVAERGDAFTSIGVLRALVVLPLVRGTAPRSAAALVAGTIATCVCATSGLWTTLAPGWTLAMLAVAALAATSALRPCTTRELQPLWRASRELPLDATACDAARLVVVLIPALAGIVVALAVLTAMPGAARLRVLAAYALVLAVGCGIEAATRDTMQPTNHASRWFLLLAVAIAFGSEVAPS